MPSTVCWVIAGPFTGTEATKQTLGQSLNKKMMGFKAVRQDAVLYPCLVKQTDFESIPSSIYRSMLKLNAFLVSQQQNV